MEFHVKGIRGISKKTLEFRIGNSTFPIIIKFASLVLSISEVFPVIKEAFNDSNLVVSNTIGTFTRINVVLNFL